MKLILRNSENELIESISFNNFELCKKVILELSARRNPAEAHLISTHERITSCECRT